MNKIILPLLLFLCSNLAAQQLNEVYVNRYNGTGDHSDKAKAMTVDAAGNIYIGGYTTTHGNHDYLILKLNPSGDTLWARTYNGTNSSEDEVNAIAVDGSGNVYVTGYAKGDTTGDDYVTIKYNSAGVQQWLVLYNSAYNEDDVANSIAVDGSGNVYVTGSSAQDAAGLNTDYVTIKYNSSGVAQWPQPIRFNGPGNGFDEAKKVVLDGNGNPVITGRVFNGFEDDWVTMKLNAANGNTIWVNYCDYTKNDRPTDMCIDAVGNVYVTGRTKASNYDLAVRKIDVNGGTVWTKFYIGTDDDRGTAVAVDAAGNVYVTGITDVNANPLIDDYNVVTLKYNAAGTQQWAKTFNGTGNASDYAEGIAVNSIGDVFVCGQTHSTGTNKDYMLLRYDSAGTLVYSKTYDGGVNGSDDAACLALVSDLPVVSGGAYAGVVNKNVVTIKYDASGGVTLTKTYDGSGDNNDEANKIVVDGGANAYTAGFSVALDEDKDFMVSKVNGGGVTEWTSLTSGTSGYSPDEAADVALDNSGNVVATGFVRDSGDSYNFCTLKLDPSGNLQWITKYDNVHESDKAVAIGVDGGGNIYVSGRTDVDSTNGTDYDFATIKYNSAGVQQWVKTNGIGNPSEEPVAIAVSSAGNVYVSGRTTTGNDDDIFTMKYNTSGTLQWQDVLGFGKDDRNEKILLDANENLYVCGRAEDANHFFDGLLIKYNSAGDTLWTRLYKGAGLGDDRFDAMAFDSAGNIIVVGYTDPDTDTLTLTSDFLIARYDPSGNLLWDTTWTHAASSQDAAKAVVCSNTGYIYVTGESNFGTVSNEDFNYVTLQYSFDGQQLAMASYDQSGGNDKARAIGILGTSVFVSGASTGPGTEYDAVVVRYDIVSDITETAATAGITAYPNPFNTSIKLNLDYVQDVDIRLMDISGRVLRTYRGVSGGEINIPRAGLAAGMYLIGLYNEEGKQLAVTRICAQ